MRSLPAAAAEEAVEPDGHAEGAAARSALRDAARAIDRARGRLRHRAPDEAVDAWRALVAGRWSLVDRFESDGRRYVIACANPLGAAGPAGLTSRERDVVRMRAAARPLKLIAYELGLGLSTVAGDLQRAIDKLGLRSSAELVQLANAMQREQSE
jgi:DNA-binding CsgD family transcriptional regulator